MYLLSMLLTSVILMGYVRWFVMVFHSMYSSVLIVGGSNKIGGGTKTFYRPLVGGLIGFKMPL